MWTKKEKIKSKKWDLEISTDLSWDNREIILDLAHEYVPKEIKYDDWKKFKVRKNVINNLTELIEKIEKIKEKKDRKNLANSTEVN